MASWQHKGPVRPSPPRPKALIWPRRYLREQGGRQWDGPRAEVSHTSLRMPLLQGARLGVPSKETNAGCATVVLWQELNRLQARACPRYFFPQEASKKLLQTTGSSARKSKTEASTGTITQADVSIRETLHFPFFGPFSPLSNLLRRKKRAHTRSGRDNFRKTSKSVHTSTAQSTKLT